MSVGRRPANRWATAWLLVPNLLGFLVWLIATSPALRIGGFVVGAASQAALIFVVWTRGVPVELPEPERPTTLNLSSR